MAKTNSTRRTAGSSHSRSKSTRVRNAGDQPPTKAAIRRAKAFFRKTRGAYLGRPENVLLGPDPAETLKRCRRVILLLSEHPVPTLTPLSDVVAARLDIFAAVLDALKHAETVLRDVGRDPDPIGGTRP